MKKIFLMLVFFGGLFIRTAVAGVSAECAVYTDCDLLVACELYSEAEKAFTGAEPDWNDAVARAARYRTTCANYPDLFDKNINTVLSENPLVRMNINWATVRAKMSGTGRLADSSLVDIIVGVLGPDTAGQQVFFTDLATAYLVAHQSDGNTFLENGFILGFLEQGDNANKYKSAYTDLTGTVFEQDLGINVDWDDLLIMISTVLDNIHRQHGALVCENNRSLQIGIDTIGWVATGLAAVGSGGLGGAAGIAGRAALGRSLQLAAKAASKMVGKGLTKKMSKVGAKQLSTAAVKLNAVKLGTRTAVTSNARYAGKGVLRTGVKYYLKKQGENLKTKRGALIAAGALIYMTADRVMGNVATHSNAGFLYSLVESDESTEFVNCQDLDSDNGCYTICGEGTGTDDLNQKALVPVMGKAYCVHRDNYTLYEINSNGSRGKPLIMSNEQMQNLRSKIETSVKDMGRCDWNEDDVDMYIGYYMYDPDTLEISENDIVITDVVRIDD
ncbi:MAG: hypothetical protein MJ187_02970 [Alphaproteobacteria bacterium]|nr:hypothetical protein [Alphaproteobacteria bacterium]